VKLVHLLTYIYMMHGHTYIKMVVKFILTKYLLYDFLLRYGGKMFIKRQIK